MLAGFNLTCIDIPPQSPVSFLSQVIVLGISFTMHFSPTFSEGMFGLTLLAFIINNQNHLS